MTENEVDAEPAGEGPSSEGKSVGRFNRLEEDRRRRDARSKNVLKVLGAAFAVVLLVGAAFVVFGMQSGSDPSDTEPAHEDKQQAVAPVPTTQELNCDNFVPSAATATHPCAMKDRFQELYQLFSTEKIPPIQALAGVDFVALALEEISALEDDAIAAFDRSDFQTALSNIEDALTRVSDIENDVERAFQNAFGNASASFESNDAPAAQNWIEEALALKGEDEATQTLARRISVLPQVLQELSDADAAVVQNDLRSAIDSLQNVIALDAQRRDVADRLQALESQYAEEQYSGLLRQANSAISAGEMSAARRALDAANRLFPSRQDVGALRARIEQIEKQQRIDRALAEARSFEGQDRWQDAAEAFGRVLSEDPSNTTASNAQERARSVLSAQRRLSSLISDQTRFGDAGIRERASSFIAEVAPLADVSPTLAGQIETTEGLILLWQTKVSVSVVSDGKSMVIVRRVGRVGVVDRKDIQLTPGNYDFECSRKGYRSKIVKHFVPPAQDGTIVTVVCDVPI